ncbi:hypothetical protein LEP1GSC076_4077 [Leptospira sp. Fiocruz LV4135]|nr:hypothetical protein LEP1GSC076_4077 [Leptospira sp. Fiocruz LV4135]
MLKVGVPTNYVSLRSFYGLKELFYDKNTRIAIAILWEFHIRDRLWLSYAELTLIY